MSKFSLTSDLNTENINENLLLIDNELALSIADINNSIKKTIYRVISSKSKRLRPMLVIAVASKLNKKFNNEILNACVAIELVHIASLIHDDIMDNAKTRRGVETINSKEGVNTAILAGDILFAKANFYASKVCKELSELVSDTIVKLCIGQASEFEYIYNSKRSNENYNTAIEGKTCALLSASSVAGGICAGVDKQTLIKLSDFGLHFGKSFQLIDDMLDFISSKNLLGKPVLNDLKEGIYNLPIILLLKKLSKAEKTDFEESKYGTNEILHLLIKHKIFDEISLEIDKYNKMAYTELSLIDKNIALLPSNYTKYAMNNLISAKYKGAINI